MSVVTPISALTPPFPNAHKMPFPPYASMPLSVAVLSRLLFPASGVGRQHCLSRLMMRRVAGIGLLLMIVSVRMMNDYSFLPYRRQCRFVFELTMLSTLRLRLIAGNLSESLDGRQGMLPVVVSLSLQAPPINAVQGMRLSAVLLPNLHGSQSMTQLMEKPPALLAQCTPKHLGVELSLPESGSKTPFKPPCTEVPSLDNCPPPKLSAEEDADALSVLRPELESEEVLEIELVSEAEVLPPMESDDRDPLRDPPVSIDDIESTPLSLPEAPLFPPRPE